MSTEADIIDGILRVESQNDRTNWVAKPKPPLGRMTRWACTRVRRGRLAKKLAGRGMRLHYPIAASRHFHRTHGVRS